MLILTATILYKSVDNNIFINFQGLEFGASSGTAKRNRAGHGLNMFWYDLICRNPDDSFIGIEPKTSNEPSHKDLSITKLSLCILRQE